MSNYKKILEQLEDFSDLVNEGETNGDSALGYFKNKNGFKYVIKKSKKTDSEEHFSSIEEREQAILNDIFTEQFTSNLANKIPSIKSAEYKVGKKNDVEFYIIILSKDFIRSEETNFQLIHGSQIFEDSDEQYEISLIDPKHKKEVITFTVPKILNKIELYLKKRIPSIDKETIEEIQIDFLKLCFFDALVGNQDRHVQNWGIITKAFYDPNFKPYFCPTFDTARAFMWNKRDSALSLKKEDIERYCNKSQAFPGISVGNKISNFKLIQEIIQIYPEIIPHYQKMLAEAKQINLDAVLDNGLFRTAFCDKRIELIKLVWKFRINELEKILDC